MHMMIMMQQNQMMMVTTLLIQSCPPSQLMTKKKKNDEEEQEEDDEDEEEISDQLVRTPSDYQPPDESEKQKYNDRVKDGEEDKEGVETNVNLEGGDVDMTEADTTKDTEDVHFISPTTDEGIDSILTPHTESTTLVNVPIYVATETPATTTTIPSPLFPVTQLSQQTPVTTTTTTNPSTTPPPIPDFASVFGFNQRVTALESDLSKLKQSNPFAEAISSIPGIVNEYLGSKMKEVVDVAIQLKSEKLREEAQAENQEFLNSLDSNMQKIIKDQVKTQTSKIKSKVEKTSDDKDKDEEPSAGSNRGTKRRRSGKEAESSKEPTRDDDVIPAREGPKRQRFYRYATNIETSKDVYSRHRIIVVISLKIMKFFGYSHLEEITVRRQDDVLYKFREGDFKRLCRQDIEDMLLILVQGKLTNLSLDD
ncbi:hypothetical protein Tco_1264109 [Tanacetum coccineum]